MTNRVLPLARRPVDLVLVAFFLFNLLFISYIVDFEQLVIPNASHFTYPIWPPRAAVDIIHWYGHAFDPVLIARPVWWKVTVGLDAVFFGPFYVLAIYAFVKGREWIRLPSLLYGTMLFTNVVIILFEEAFGENPTPYLPVVLALNLPYLLVPIHLVYRMWRYEHPFAVGEREVAALPVASGKTEAVRETVRQ